MSADRFDDLVVWIRPHVAPIRTHKTLRLPNHNTQKHMTVITT